MQNGHQVNSTLRILVCGDSACGKSTFLHSFIYQKYKEVGILGPWNDESREFQYGQERYNLELTRCSGAYDYLTRINQVSSEEPYTVVLFCYAVDDHQSFSSVDNKWL